MAPKQPAQAPPAEKHESKFLAFTRKAVVDIAIVAAVGLLAFSILSDVWSSAYSIGAIDVPDTFGKEVEDRDGIATALRMEVGRLANEAQTGVAVKPDVPEASEPDLSVAGTKIPLRYAAGLARTLLKLPYVSITGQLLPPDAGPAAPLEPEDQACRVEPGDGPERSGKPMRLVLSRTDAATGPFFDCTGPFPAILHRGAWATLKLVDPFAAATLLSKKAGPSSADQRRAILMIRDGLATARAQEMPLWLQAVFPIWPDRVSRAHLSLGNVYLAIDDQGRAQQEFSAASDEAAARSLFGHRSAAAEDGESIVALNISQRDRAHPGPHAFGVARARACAALRLKPDLDSAAYHLAQSEDYRARYRLANDAAYTCSAGAIAQSACSLYSRLLLEHPAFTIAYVQQGELILQRLDHLMKTGQDGCAALGNEARARLEADLARFADASFATAVMLDPKGNFDPWLQWGILNFVLQQHPIMDVDRQPQARLQRIDKALGRYRVALTLDRANFYIWFRVAEALSARASLDPFDRDRDADLARTAACEARARDVSPGGLTSRDLSVEAGLDMSPCDRRAPEAFLSGLRLPDPGEADPKTSLDCPAAVSEDGRELNDGQDICARPDSEKDD